MVAESSKAQHNVQTQWELNDPGSNPAWCIYTDEFICLFHYAPLPDSKLVKLTGLSGLHDYIMRKVKQFHTRLQLDIQTYQNKYYQYYLAINRIPRTASQCANH